MSTANTFPKFKPLALEDRDTIEKHTNPFQPYSDFNFFSLWGYMHTQCEWSILHGNLVFKLIDYLDQSPFLSFIGNNKFRETITELHSYANELTISPKLKFIPSILVEQNNDLHKDFHIEDDPDNFDYILDIELLAKMEGKHYASKRHELNRFHRTHTDHSFRLVSVDTHRHHVERIFQKWKDGEAKDTWEHEYEALSRIMDQTHLPYDLYYLEIDNEPSGFVIVEKLPHQYAMLHYWKTDKKLTNAYALLMHAVAKDLHQQGYKYLNFQQDLGLAHLKESKSRWHPVFHLTKSAISPKPVPKE